MRKTSKKLDKSASFTCGLASKVLLAAAIVGCSPVYAYNLTPPSLGDDCTYIIKEATEETEKAYGVYDLREVTETYTYTDIDGSTVTKEYKTYAADLNYNVAEQKPEISSGGNQFWTNQYWNWNGDDLPDDVTGNYVNFQGHGVLVDTGGTIGNLNGDFLNNTDDGWVVGIYNSGTITGIKGDFVNNVNNSSSQNLGITNMNGIIGDINSNFINNQLTGSGKLIYNQNGTIGDITGDFIANKANSGILIYNLPGTSIGNVKGNFINNSGFHSLLYNTNDSIIKSISGNFSGNTNNSLILFNNVNSNIDFINANFINNHVETNIIYNNSYSTIGSITGDFTDNTTGAQLIFNVADATIGEINSNFINNNADILIANTGGTSNIGDITGNFINNTTRVNLIFNNQGKIGNIKGDFIQNTNGGYHTNFIANGHGQIGNIDGNFIKNSTTGYLIFNAGSVSYDWRNDTYYSDGYGTIGNITGDFIENETGSVLIFNAGGVMGNLTGNFINNSGSNGGHTPYLIFNSSGIIGDITGSFVGNHIDESSSSYYSGYTLLGNNAGNIGKITGDFIGNTGWNTIISNNNGTLGDIVGNFVDNNVKYYLFDNSGARKNFSITGNFVNNTVGGDKLLFNSSSTLDFINGDFIGNKSTLEAVSGTSSSALLYNNGGTIGYLESDFINNEGFAYLIKNSGGEIGSITGHVEGNSLKELGTSPFDLGYIANQGGVIGDITLTGSLSNLSSDISDGGLGINNLGGELGNITANFENLTATRGKGAAIRNGYAYNKIPAIDSIAGQFKNNTSAYGGAIYSDGGTIGNIKADFIDNKAIDGNGGAISNGGGDIGNIQGNFVNNTAATNSNPSFGGGGAIWNAGGRIGEISNSRFENNKGSWSGGAIFSDGGRITEIRNSDFINNSAGQVGGALSLADAEITNGIVNTNFIGNHITQSESSGRALGGAIYANSDLDIIADNGSSIFSGNYTESLDGIKEDNAIYMDNSKSINFRLKNGGNIIMNDKINGVDGYQVNISGDNKDNTAFYLFNDIQNASVNVNNTTINTINNNTYAYDFNTFTVSGDTNMAADVDLINKEIDRFTADSYGNHTGTLYVNNMNLLNDAPVGQDVTAVYFAQPDLKEFVGEVPDNYKTLYTPLYKYNVSYDNRNQYDGKGDGGYFLFTRGGSSNPSDVYNPAVLATPVGNLAAGQAAMNEAFKYVFEHADAFTQLPAMERYAKINANKYALSTDFNENMPSYADQLQNKAVWFRPYTTFESMNIKNGPKVDAITYGSLVGFDGDFKEMKNGWSRVFTGYAGYMGSSLNYSGVDTTMNGGLLGFTETFYKGNFWTAITASAGASVGESHTMYGKEDYTSLLAGVGSKTGYNFEFKDGKFIIQPIMFLSYTFVNTFDYKNAAGVSIESDPLHTIQLNPSVRFIANLKGGWQPYASVGMVWNLMNESKVTANNVKLPEMSVKPYVEYGVGVQRNWADKFTAFLQAMIRNGGRNGVALTGGFRFMLGSEPKNSDKPKVKKEIKSL